MNINDAYPSKYIKEADLQGKPRVLTVARVSVESLDQSSGETKPVVYFQSTQKGLVLNITNKNVFVLLYGAETNNWTGRQIELYPSQTDFRGDVVPCIRCRAPGATGALGTVPPVALQPLPASTAPSTFNTPGVMAADGAGPDGATDGGHTPEVTPPHQPAQTGQPGQSMAAEIDDEIPFAPLKMLP